MQGTAGMSLDRVWQDDAEPPLTACLGPWVF